MNQKQKGAHVFAALNQLADEYETAGKAQHAHHIRQAMKLAPIDVLARLYGILQEHKETV